MRWVLERPDRTMEHEAIAFKETQRFRHPLVWLIVGLVAMIFWVTMALGIIWTLMPGSIPGGLDRADLPAMLAIWGICWLLFGVGLPLLMASIRLTVEVGRAGIALRYARFYSRLITWATVRASETRRFRPFKDYGGLGGIRWTPGKGRAIFVDGNQGVWMELSDGEPLLIGSQRPEELLSVIQSMQSLGTNASV